MRGEMHLSKTYNFRDNYGYDYSNLIFSFLRAILKTPSQVKREKKGKEEFCLFVCFSTIKGIFILAFRIRGLHCNSA